MPLINSLVSWFITKRIYQIEFFKRYPVEVQNDILDSLIREAQDTAFGRDHHFNTIRSYKDFKDRVPVREYPAIRPYIDRAFKGESDVLWPGDVKWFAKSSGTTSEKSKFIPVTRNYMQDCHFQGGKDTLTLYFNNNPDSSLLMGKSLVVGEAIKYLNINQKSSLATCQLSCYRTCQLMRIGCELPNSASP